LQPQRKFISIINAQSLTGKFNGTSWRELDIVFLAQIYFEKRREDINKDFTAFWC
jgi:hypothetical protein